MRTVIPLEHAFGARYELPLPLWLFVTGGALVVLLSFVVVARRHQDPLVAHEADALRQHRRPGLAAALAVLLTLFVAVTGVLGSQEVAESIAPLFFWVGLWVVVPMTVGALGDWTHGVNPFRAVAAACAGPRTRKAVLARSAPLAWPGGWWVAVVLYVLLVLGELVYNVQATTPAFVGGLLLAYLAVCAVAGLVFGDAFVERGEVFGVVWDTWGRLGFFRFGAPGRRGFAGGLDTGFARDLGRVVLVLLLLLSVNFDGLLATPQWSSYERRVFGADLHGVDTLRTGSLVAVIVLGLLLFGGFATWSLRARGDEARPLTALAVLLPSLVPIAYGYLLAHYLQYVVTNGQLLFPLIGNPGYKGWPLHPPYPFNDTYEVNARVLPNSAYWYLSVLVIVAVHVVAVLVANRHLATGDARRSRRAEYPWLVAMVAYTAFSLFLIAQPLTKGAS